MSNGGINPERLLTIVDADNYELAIDAPQDGEPMALTVSSADRDSWQTIYLTRSAMQAIIETLSEWVR